MKNRILPMIVGRSADVLAGIVSQPLVNGLFVAYAIDNDRTITYIPKQRFESWGISIETLHTTAIDNLTARSESLAVHAAQDDDGQVVAAHSVAPGLDYPGVGPEHAELRDKGRAAFVTVDDEEAVAAFHRLSRLEGIIPALESAHAIAWLLGDPPAVAAGSTVVVCLSGRGDKDVAAVAEREATVARGEA